MALAQMVEASHTPATAVTAPTPRRAAAGVSSGAATANSTLSSQPQGGYARPTSLPRRRRLRSARFQILLLELSGATLLLLDEPTDNLDLDAAEALEDGLDAFDGTVVAVTHDRWFARGVRPLPRVRRGRSRLKVHRTGRTKAGWPGSADRLTT